MTKGATEVGKAIGSRWAAAAACLLAACAGPMVSGPATTFALSGASHRSPSHRSSQRLLYVSGLGSYGQILVYSASLRAKNAQPIRTITTGANRPFGIWVDAAGTLYVVNQVDGGANSSVTEFHPGESTPFLTITDGLTLPQTVAVDATGTVYVNDSYNGGQIEVYAAGAVHPLRTISVGGTMAAAGMAFDKRGNLLAAYQLPQERLHIFKVPNGSSKAKLLDIDYGTVAGPGLATDRFGNLYVGSQSAAAVEVYPPGSGEPSRTISGVPAYGLLTATGAGTLYVAGGGQGVAEIAAGGSTVVNSIIGPPTVSLEGVALSP